jgi:parallel beta-helix repeat protein
MTLKEARRILGLGVDEDPREHLEEFRAVRGRIADMACSAPNEKLAQRYKEDLAEFDNALAAVREYLGLPPGGEDVKVPDKPSAKRGRAIFVPENEVVDPSGLPALPKPPPAVAENEDDPEPSIGKILGVFAWLLLFLSLAGVGGWTYLKIEGEKKLANDSRVAFLERQGATFIENRRWPEAALAFDEIEKIYPNSELVTIGRQGIEAGMAEEQNQFIGYWKGEAIAAFEANRWDDSAAAAKQVLDKYPDEEELRELVGKIAAAKVEEEREAVFIAVREGIGKRDFDKAISAARDLAAKDTDDEEAAALLKEALAAKAKAEADLLRAKELMAQAAARDTGEFDEQAIQLMREAMELAPDDAEIAVRYEKMAAYARTINIPGDVETIQEALLSVRDRDRLVIAEGTWVGPFVIPAAVQLEGVSGKTIIECAADAGSVITFAPGVKGARMSGLTLRHLSFDAGAERFSLALVRNAEVDFSDCRFEQGSGHGIAVTEGGHAKVVRCRFSENGWNGIAAIGAGSRLVADSNTINGNFQNGIEAWDGAAAILSKNKCTGNSRNGIHIDAGAASASVSQNTLSGNREFGLVVSSAGSGEITGNTMAKNILGGMVIKAGGSKVTAKDNEITANGGPGLVLGKGISADPYKDNRISGNTGEQIMVDVDLSTGE